MSGKNEYIAALEAQNRDLRNKLEEMACKLEEARQEAQEQEVFCIYQEV
jgi:Lhr-like helicase